MSCFLLLLSQRKWITLCWLQWSFSATYRLQIGVCGGQQWSNRYLQSFLSILSFLIVDSEEFGSLAGSSGSHFFTSAKMYSSFFPDESDVTVSSSSGYFPSLRLHCSSSLWVYLTSSLHWHTLGVWEGSAASLARLLRFASWMGSFCANWISLRNCLCIMTFKM